MIEELVGDISSTMNQVSEATTKAVEHALDPPDIREIKEKLAENARRRLAVLKDQGYNADNMSDDLVSAASDSLLGDFSTANLGKNTRSETPVLISLYYKFPDQLGNPRRS